MIFVSGWFKMSPMQIIVNGQSQTIAPKASLRDLVTQFSKTPQHIIAELNGAIIPKQDWIATPLKAEDKIELVTFVGGG